jgi:elongation factor 1-alpha
MKTEHDLDLKIKLSNISQIYKERDIEYDYGNREYKLKICDLTDQRIEELATQMKFRLEEGSGECFYEIGVEDNGNPLGLPLEDLEQSIENIKIISSKLNAKADILKIHQGKSGLIAEIIVKNKEDIQRDKIEIKIGLLGEEGSGKSTLVSLNNI